MSMKMDRLLAIVMLLMNRRRVSARELADRFEVSLRTVYRDVETICQSGVPVVSHAGSSGGYEIMERYRLERQFLSMEELQSLFIALRGIGPTLDDGHIGGLLDKVGAMLAKTESDRLAGAGAEEHVVIDLNSWKSDPAEKERLQELRRAIGDCRLVEFTYTNGAGDRMRRTCEPMLVVLKGYVWYLYGYCRMRDDFRIFRLSRIRSLQVLKETFERRASSFDGTNMVWNRGADVPVVPMKLRFHPRRRAQVEDYYGTEQVKALPDGSLLVEAAQPDEPWLYGWLLGFGSDARVLEPESIAARVKEEALKIVRQYEEH